MPCSATLENNLSKRAFYLSRRACDTICERAAKLLLPLETTAKISILR